MPRLAHIRYWIIRLFERLGIKEIALATLKRAPLPISSQSLESLASKFYQQSQGVLVSLPLDTKGKVLFVTGRAIDQKFSMVDGLLGWALRWWGVKSLFLICDGPLTTCELSTINEFQSEQVFLDAIKPAVCTRCFVPNDGILRAFGWAPDRLSAFIDAEDWQEARNLVLNLDLKGCFDLKYDEIHIGEHIESTTYRTLFSADLSAESIVALNTARRAAQNAIVIAKASKRILTILKPDKLVVHHGIYLTGGIICDYAKREGIPVVNWTIPYRRGTVLFSHGDTYHRTMIHEPVSVWEDYPLTIKDRARLGDYLNSHYKSGWDLVSYNRDTDDNPERLAKELDLDSERPIVSLYTNLAWDARIHYSGIIFPHHAEWLAQTVGYFMDKPHIQLVIRVHPAEIKSGLGPVRERADALIYERYSQLPAHIKIIPPESALSSYALMQLAKVNVVFGTKLGLEMAAMGLPVIVVGEAWYRAKGFTYDPISLDQYFEWLENPQQVEPLSKEQTERAIHYAYHFYFRRMISFPSLVFSPDHPYVKSLKDLQIGEYPNLDVICKGIIDQSEFLAKTV